MGEYNYFPASTSAPIDASIFWRRLSELGPRINIMGQHRGAKLILYLKYHIKSA